MIREILLMNMLANVRLHFLAMQRLANKLQWPGCKSGIRVKILMTNIFCSQLSKLLPAGPKRQTMTRMLIRQLRYVQIISSNLLMSNSRQNARNVCIEQSRVHLALNQTESYHFLYRQALLSMNCSSSQSSHASAIDRGTGLELEFVLGHCTVTARCSSGLKEDNKFHYVLPGMIVQSTPTSRCNFLSVHFRSLLPVSWMQNNPHHTVPFRSQHSLYQTHLSCHLSHSDLASSEVTFVLRHAHICTFLLPVSLYLCVYIYLVYQIVVYWFINVVKLIYRASKLMFVHVFLTAHLVLLAPSHQSCKGAPRGNFINYK